MGGGGLCIFLLYSFNLHGLAGFVKYFFIAINAGNVIKGFINNEIFVELSNNLLVHFIYCITSVQRTKYCIVHRVLVVYKTIFYYI